jgi:hypothetical protein
MIIADVLKTIFARPSALNRFKAPYPCEICSSPATMDNFVEKEEITRMHRLCDQCKSSTIMILGLEIDNKKKNGIWINKSW